MIELEGYMRKCAARFMVGFAMIFAQPVLSGCLIDEAGRAVEEVGDEIEDTGEAVEDAIDD